MRAVLIEQVRSTDQMANFVFLFEKKKKKNNEDYLKECARNEMM